MRTNRYLELKTAAGSSDWRRSMNSKCRPKTTDKLKILGVTLDSSLTFDQHILNTVRNCNFHLRALRHIRSSLTPDVANMMACSVIGSRIDYCNSLLNGISKQNLDRLQRVQNKAARIVCNASRYATSSALLHSLHWLPVRHHIEFKTATLCFKAVKLGTPYLKNLFNPYEPVRSLRSSCMDPLTVPRTATAFGCRHFAVTGPRIWNGLPQRGGKVQYSSVFQVPSKDISLPSSHGQLTSSC